MQIIALILILISSSIQFTSATPQSETIARIVEEIRNNEFQSAQQIILTISNISDVVPEVVKTIYNGSEKNIDLILNFSKASTKISISWNFLSELRNEMKKRGNQDPYKLMALAKSLRKDVYNHQTVNNNYKTKTLINEIQNENVNSIKEILKSHMASNTFQNNTNVRQLLGAILEFNINSSEELMQGLVNDMISTVPPVRIADDIMNSCTSIKQIISGLSFLFWKLVHNNDKNNQAIVRIAYYIAQLKAMINYNNTSKKAKYTANALIEQLPTCARNLNFAKEVCIRNKRKNEYIFPSNTEFYPTSKRRAVFSCNIDQLTNDGAWKVSLINNKYYFKNQAYKREYLNASPFEIHDANNRHIQTWAEEASGEGSMSNSSAWSIELNGNYCYIKNYHFNEYLYASDLIYRDQNRYVFSAKGAISGKVSDDYLWQIENCS